MIEEGFIPGAPIRVSNPPPEIREYMVGDDLYIFTAASFSYDPEETWEQEEGVIEDFTADNDRCDGRNLSRFISRRRAHPPDRHTAG